MKRNFRSKQHKSGTKPFHNPSCKQFAKRTSQVLAALTLAASYPAVLAQVLYGGLTGNVTDTTGGLISNADVKALNLDTGIARETHSNDQGLYSFTDLTPGRYRITVTAPGFTVRQQENVGIQTNTTVRFNADLKVGASSQEVTVDAGAAPILETDRAETNYNISQEQIAELPTTSTTGRNFQSLYRLVPGSTPPAEQNSAGGNPQRAQAVNVNGVSNATNTTRIDGSVDAYPWLPYLVAYLPPTDGIDSINVVTGSFNAEQGAAGGSAINVTMKSGTNRFHGSAWEYNSIAQFNAQSWSNRTGVRQKNIYNEVGGAIGGPIVKNRLFFFFDYNRVSVNKAINGTLSVPTAAMRNGDFSAFLTPTSNCTVPNPTAAQSAGCIYDPATGNAAGVGRTGFAGNIIPAGRFAPAAVIMLQNLPLPTTPSAATNNFFGSATNAFLRENYDSKVTYTPTDRTSFFGHYSISPNTINDPQVFGSNPGGGTYDGGQPGAATGRIQNVGLGFTHAFTPHFATDWNAGYTRQRLGAQAGDIGLGDYGVNVLKIPGTNYNGLPLYGGIPGFYFTTYSGIGNANTGSPFNFRDNQYTANANATYTHGNHSIRFGGEYLHAAINHIQPGSGNNATARGAFVFSGGATANASGAAAGATNSFASFLLGQAENYQKSIQSFNPEPLRYSTFAFFAQDTWQATPKLTLNYGVRYEYYPLPTGDHFGTVRYDPSVRSTIAGVSGTVGTVLVGGENGIPQHANTSNGWGMIVPRLGFAYRADDKTVVRAGFGMTVDPDTLRNLLQAYPAGIATNIVGNTGFTPATSLNAGLLSPTTQVGIPNITIPDITQGYLPLPANLSTNTIPQKFRRGYIYSDNLSIQRELPAQFSATVAYVGTIAVRQQSSVNINAAPPGGGNAGRLLNTTYGANTNNTDLNALQPFRGSNYHGLQTQLTRTSPKHVSTGIVYTYSKSMDASDNSQASGLTFAYPTYYDRNWALAGYDRKHNFQWWTVSNLPFGPGQKYLTSGALGYIVGGWRLSTVLSRVSGTPFSITDAGTYLNAPGNTQLADRNYGVTPYLSQRSNQFGIANGFQYVNPAAFTSVTATNSTGPRFGNSGRNSVRGPGIFNLDAGLKRSFPIHDQIALELQAESFDVTNTPQFANPGTLGINSVSATPPTVASQLGSFGVITSSNANRTLRFSGRVTF